MRVCLITTGQPSTNPRLVKEADALTDAGHAVHVVGAHWTRWASETDARVLANRRWTATLVDWRRTEAPALYVRSRLRHWVARRLTGVRPASVALATAALSRVGPELRRAALAVPADLYIAHNIGALPVARDAAAAVSARFAFDAEDFHSGQFAPGEHDAAKAATQRAERRWLTACAHVTAAAPMIAEAYRDLCAIPLPTTILNVFPLSERPSGFPRRDGSGPVRLYWFSQTIGANRGLEDVVRGIGMLGDAAVELHLRGVWQPGYEDTLRRVAAESGVRPDRVVSHAPASPDEMVRLAAAYDVGLAMEPGHTANSDMALSNKLFTCLLAGNAVVATRTRGQRALEPDLGAAAAWCDAGQPASFAAALRPWLDRRASLASARSDAWALGERRFNWDLEKVKWLNVIERAVRTPVPQL